MTAKASEGAVRAAAYMFDSEDAKIYVHGYSHGWYSLPQVAELIDTLAVQPERDRADKIMRALESLTPSGSEYVNDPERCVQFVRDARDSQMKAMLNWKKQRDEERDRALEESAAKVQEFFDRWKQCSCGESDEKWIAKKAGKMYNTESGHAIDCVMDDLFELVRAIRSLKGGR